MFESWKNTGDLKNVCIAPESFPLEDCFLSLPVNFCELTLKCQKLKGDSESVFLAVWVGLPKIHMAVKVSIIVSTMGFG